MQPIATWALALMMYVSPAERFRSSHVKGAEETLAQRNDRYEQIATAVDEVVASSPPLVPGEYGRAYTTAVLMLLTYVESGWRKDVDLGIARDKRALYGEEDHGRSWCMGQINIDKGTVPVGDDTMKTWHGKDLIADRTKCFRVVLEMVRRSFASCQAAGLPKEQWLNQYASGECKPNPEVCKGDEKCLAKQERKYADASRKSRARMQMATRIFVRFRDTAPKDEAPPAAPVPQAGAPVAPAPRAAE